MNKKVLGLVLVLLFVAMLATPLVGTVMADPTQGQKVAVTLTWIPTGTTYVSDFTGIVEHRHAEGNWIVVLEIDGGATYTGTAVNTVRETLLVPQKDGVTVILRECLEMWFPSAGGGFEGRYTVVIDGVGGESTRGRAHGLFHGTGAFEGQTINAGHKWVVPTGPPVWTGYLLMP